MAGQGNEQFGSIDVGRIRTIASGVSQDVTPVFGSTVLVAGTKTVAAPFVTATSAIFLSQGVLGTVTTAKSLAVTARVAGTSFTITSADVTDTSTVYWWLVG